MFSFYRGQTQKAVQPKPVATAQLKQAHAAVDKAQKNYDHALAVYYECRDPQQQAEAKQYYLDLGRILSKAQEHLRSIQNQ